MRVRTHKHTYHTSHKHTYHTSDETMLFPCLDAARTLLGQIMDRELLVNKVPFLFFLALPVLYLTTWSNLYSCEECHRLPPRFFFSGKFCVCHISLPLSSSALNNMMFDWLFRDHVRVRFLCHPLFSSLLFFFSPPPFLLSLSPSLSCLRACALFSPVSLVVSFSFSFFLSLSLGCALFLTLSCLLACLLALAKLVTVGAHHDGDPAQAWKSSNCSLNRIWTRLPPHQCVFNKCRCKCSTCTYTSNHNLLRCNRCKPPRGNCAWCQQLASMSKGRRTAPRDIRLHALWHATGNLAHFSVVADCRCFSFLFFSVFSDLSYMALDSVLSLSETSALSFLSFPWTFLALTK